MGLKGLRNSDLIITRHSQLSSDIWICLPVSTDNQKGLKTLLMIISRYSDGYFDVVIKAANSPDPSKADFALIKIFVLQDTDLMKFVFDKNPVSVAKQMREFKTEIEAAFAQVFFLFFYLIFKNI